MSKILSGIFVAHDYRYIAAAVAACILGSLLTMRLFSRARRTKGVQKMNWLFLAGIIGGSSAWTAHFLAMLGYHADTMSGYEPFGALLSLAIAVASVMTGLSLAAYGGKSLLVEAGGLIVGLGIALMHYMGMKAYLVAGEVTWDGRYVAVSMVLAAVFGMLATSRMARPVWRLCQHGASLAMMLAIATTHVAGMAALQVVADSAVTMPQGLVSASVMSVGVIAIMIVLLALGASIYTIDAQSTRLAVERYRHLSLHDALTGLPNRAAFNEYIAIAASRQRSGTENIAVLSFDLDRFKEVNDVHGHQAGDKVLRTVAERIGAVLKPGEFVARVGGDEFIAITENYYVQADAIGFARRLLGEIMRPVIWDERQLCVGSSVGVAIFPQDSGDTNDLLAKADVAMYRAKSAGNNAIRFYEASMDQAARARSALAMDMRVGLRNGEFHIYYQQQNDTVSGEIIGFEALLRWMHPRRGMVSPGEFIPVAEKTGFILELGEWVLHMACKEAATWKKPLCIAINVASQQLADPYMPAKMARILAETGIDPARVELEITESGIVEDQAHALFIVRQLKLLGVKVAMDDYGTGYSSLSTLQTFPFDKIKIDRAFIDGVVESPQSAAIVRSTLILAASLNIPVLAEGVETEAHMDFLRSEGCLQVQGYFFGKPVPRGDIQAFVGEHPQEVRESQVPCPEPLRRISAR